MSELSEVETNQYEKSEQETDRYEFHSLKRVHEHAKNKNKNDQVLEEAMRLARLCTRST